LLLVFRLIGVFAIPKNKDFQPPQENVTKKAPNTNSNSTTAPVKK